MNATRRAIAGRLVQAAAVFWAAELVLLLVYTLLARSAHASVSTTSTAVAGTVIAFVAGVIAAWFVAPRLGRDGVPPGALRRLTMAGPLAATALTEVASLFSGGLWRGLLLLAGSALGCLLGLLAHQRSAGGAAFGSRRGAERKGVALRPGSVSRRRSQPRR